MMPWTVADTEIVEPAFGEDPWPYGIERNRKTLGALVRIWSSNP
jgi:hypothetical protein